jgi:hypothetical protein
LFKPRHQGHADGHSCCRKLTDSCGMLTGQRHGHSPACACCISASGNMQAHKRNRAMLGSSCQDDARNTSRPVRACCTSDSGSMEAWPRSLRPGSGRCAAASAEAAAASRQAAATYDGAELSSLSAPASALIIASESPATCSCAWSCAGSRDQQRRQCCASQCKTEAKVIRWACPPLPALQTIVS